MVARLPEVLSLRESLFKRSESDVASKQFLEIEVPLTHNFWRVKRMLSRRLKSQPDPEDSEAVLPGSELNNRWRLSDGIQHGDTVHVKMRLRSVEPTEFVRKRDAWRARVNVLYLTEDNIVTAAYVVGLLVIVVALVAWPGDVDRSGGIAPLPPEAARSSRRRR